jgi:hypothetical protein
MRGDAMRKTPLMGTGIFPHADTHFMAAMTLQGTFIELPHVLFYRRMHRNALSANPSGQESKVFWTASQGTFVLPRWRYELAGFEVVLKASLPVREKARLLGYSIKRLAWFRRELAQDVRRALSSNVNVPQ